MNVLFSDVDYTVATFDHEAGIQYLGDYLDAHIGTDASRKITNFTNTCFWNLLARGKGEEYNAELFNHIQLASRDIQNHETARNLLHWSRELWIKIATEEVLKTPLSPEMITRAAQSYWNGIARCSREYQDALLFFSHGWIRDALEVVLVSSSDARLCVQASALAYDPEYSTQKKRERIPRYLLSIAGNNLFSGDPVGKPDSRFWQRVLTNVGYKQEEDTGIMVGDSYKTDSYGVRQFGIIPILIDRTGATKPEDVPEAEYVIKSFAELAPILKKIQAKTKRIEVRKGIYKMTEGSRFAGVNPELFLPLNEQDKSNPEWLVEVDDNIISYTSGARFFNPKREIEWRLGRRSDGYVGVIGHEAGGGGTVIIPFTFYDGQLWIGLLTQERKTQGGNVLNVPRGYLDPEKTHFQNALKEMREETGVWVEASRITDLSPSSKPANPNSANYDTSREGEGVRFYNWQTAAAASDMFTNAAVARLLSYLNLSVF